MTYQHYATASLYSRHGQRKYLTRDERARFIEAATSCKRAELRTLCLTLAWTGCRISEALALTARCIEIEPGFISVWTLKRRSRIPIVREIPAPPALITALANVHPLDGSLPDRRLWQLSRSRAWTLIKGVMCDAGITDGAHATPKGLRHGFGLHAIRCGVPINLVQRWLGHASMTTTAIYLNAIGDEERMVAARMWEL